MRQFRDTVQRTLRQSRARSAPHGPRSVALPRPEARGPGEPPELSRLRAKLAFGTPEMRRRGATLLLELTEPDSLDTARADAFPGGRASVAAETALEEAWERFRYDRHRAQN